jgi:hypothetical protein
MNLIDRIERYLDVDEGKRAYIRGLNLIDRIERTTWI